MQKSRLPITLKRKKAGREDLKNSDTASVGVHRSRLSFKSRIVLSNVGGSGVESLGSSSNTSVQMKSEDDPPYKMYTLDSERLRAIEALSEEPPQSPTIHMPTSLRRLIISDDEDEDKELVQSSCESDQGIGSMPSSIISVSGHGNPLPEEKEDDDDSVSTVETRSRKKGLATKRSELLQDKPIIPNIHVGSKLKAMLEENKFSTGGTKKRLTKKMGKWDAIMKNINENQKTTEKRTYKEVKSKVFGDLGGSSSPRAKTSKSGSNAKSNSNNSGRSSSRTSLASTGRTESYQSESHRDKANGKTKLVTSNFAANIFLS
ncbi:unnamed protein product [Lepeophtheirus salmonis]|uniref:(salmon louse) hypothetical protein n=1 Tax=Lepeophtheirus salmonis TaxID=72036 RepID=A0A7R8CWC3_LEPSM|nr:unnamed protein product [Lepeophtheirus salmonis]CAF2950535.1 unnamed protein product [Lepeophtheirus salmonis]